MQSTLPAHSANTDQNSTQEPKKGSWAEQHTCNQQLRIQGTAPDQEPQLYEISSQEKKKKKLGLVEIKNSKTVETTEILFPIKKKKRESG